MKVDCFALGVYQTNCFVIRPNEQRTECLVIDPGFDAEPLVRFLKENALVPQKILLTHGHCDHIAGLELLKRQYASLPVHIGDKDAEMLTNADANLSSMMGFPLQYAPAEVQLAPGDLIDWETLHLAVLATPGHTPGSVSFYCRDARVVFVGDALFAGSIGRTDFPNGNSQQLLDSIRQQLFTLPDETIVYSGHGPETTIGHEKRTNPFLT
ncbi:MAG: MBL fold metallo-hydrolase [Phycisphaerae bacterium]|nr:MBL fold metallo-hydrolase [Phycisphaerae bacterium]